LTIVLGLWVRGMTRREGAARCSDWTAALYHVVTQCPCTRERSTHWDHSHSPSQIQPRMGWGRLGRKEEAEAHPVRQCDCKGSCSFIDEPFFDE